VIDLGRLPYDAAYALQVEHHAEVLAAREAGTPDPGRILLVEHDPPVITVSRREGARRHLLATPELLAARGVTLAETDRGGDITYHGPGQLVAYPILDLNVYHLGLHDYMRLLEASVIDTLAGFGLPAERDRCATGVWVPQPVPVATGAAHAATPPPPHTITPACPPDPAATAKICAMGVRVRRWISMHGLALNVTTNLDHFTLIVPCGLAGRPVTSLKRELGDRCPPMPAVKTALAAALTASLAARRPDASAPAAD
jgi:lipoyl(octanoyl) transferase